MKLFRLFIYFFFNFIALAELNLHSTDKEDHSNSQIKLNEKIYHEISEAKICEFC